MSMKILVADDDRIIRDLLSRSFTDWGYEVQQAQDGEEAWRMLGAEEAARLLVLDWQMPELDGLSLCRRLRAASDLPYVYVIMLTGKGNRADVVEALDSGADDYLLKPFQSDELKSRVAVGARVVAYEEILARKNRELQQRLNELAASRASFTNIVDKSVDAILIVDPEGVIRFANREIDTFFEQSADSMVGTKAPFPVGPAISADIALAGGRTGEIRVTETEWEGTQAFLAVVRDSTERSRIMDELRRAKEGAEAGTRAKDLFLSKTSHELRTPLNSIIGFARILLEDEKGGVDGRAVTFVERILKNGTHLLALINDLLDLSRIESGGMDVRSEPVLLPALLRETAEAMAPQFEEKGVELVVECPESVRPVMLDEQRLTQVLFNLVGNALKFTKRGSVTMRVQADAMGLVPECLDVIDTGGGIPSGELAKVFEAFFQVDAGTSRRHEGAGLGLSISKSLLTLMGCRLQVASRVGSGSVFRIVFPDGSPPPLRYPGQDGETRA